MFRAVVRYGRLRHLAELAPESDALAEPRPGSACVVRTDRGLELGHVLALATAPATSPAPLASSNGRAYVRAATREDLEQARAAAALEERARTFAHERARASGLALRVVGAERLFSGERLIVYYTAEDRLDLRELAREVQAEIGTRVELRQLGARERARACGGTGVCGRALCCSTFLRELEPVTLRMAKVQGFSLSPDATQGVCGRLKCCLRYENPLYEEGRALMPRLGVHVEAARASGEVVALSVLSRKITVRTPDGRLVDLFAAEVAAAKQTPRRLPLANATPAPPETASDRATPPPAASASDTGPVEGAPAPAKPRDSRWRGLTRRLFGRGPTSPTPPPSDFGKFPGDASDEAAPPDAGERPSEWEEQP